MIHTLRRTLSVYSAFAAMVPKLFLAYSIWVWMHFITQVIALIIFVSFWRAVYAGQVEISGLNLDQTLNYIILSQLFLPAALGTSTIHRFGSLMREGLIGIELLRPVDFQAASYVHMLSRVVMDMILQIPLGLIAWLLFRFHLPMDPLLWLAFWVTLFLGNALL
jgi:ABC-2 type transport system permease protein